MKQYNNCILRNIFSCCVMKYILTSHHTLHKTADCVQHKIDKESIFVQLFYDTSRRLALHNNCVF